MSFSPYSWFQFLLGRLKTKEGRSSSWKKYFVSIPLRQAKNYGKKYQV